MNTTGTETGLTDDGWSPPEGDDGFAASEQLVVDVEGFEGPLDLLLALARTQKVDLARISVLALVEQYLAYIAEAQRLKLELAGDYLVMAAWLAYLKSKLLLPKEKSEDGEPTAEEMAQKIAFRLKRLEAMRNAVANLMTRKRLGLDVFARGMPEGVTVVRDTRYSAEIFDLLKAYADQRRRTVKVMHVVKARKVWSIKEARQRLETLVGRSIGAWMQLDLFLDQYLPEGEDSRSVVASSFGATLELAREGVVELRQDEAFSPLFVRKREEGAEWRQLGAEPA
ncbi:MAG: ScpA family protein [Hyphomicrobium sp.]|nr:ScpA family protein [Hyphomicrobium sp.]